MKSSRLERNRPSISRRHRRNTRCRRQKVSWRNRSSGPRDSWTLEIILKEARNQVENLLPEIEQVVKLKERVLVTTLTKRFAEDLTDFLLDKGVRAKYLHSDVDTLERVAIVRDLRMGKFDVLVGVNLLREGLDLPEVSLVAILDADKEGFLRSQTSLIQTCGRAARNLNGRVIMFADAITGSMRRAMDETERRRASSMNTMKRTGSHRRGSKNRSSTSFRRSTRKIITRCPSMSSKQKA